MQTQTIIPSVRLSHLSLQLTLRVLYLPLSPYQLIRTSTVQQCEEVNTSSSLDKVASTIFALLCRTAHTTQQTIHYTVRSSWANEAGKNGARRPCRALYGPGHQFFLFLCATGQRLDVTSMWRPQVAAPCTMTNPDPRTGLIVHFCMRSLRFMRLIKQGSSSMNPAWAELFTVQTTHTHTHTHTQYHSRALDAFLLRRLISFSCSELGLVHA